MGTQLITAEQRYESTALFKDQVIKDIYIYCICPFANWFAQQNGSL